MITSKRDIFYRLGYWLRFLNFREKEPQMMGNKKPTKISVSESTHGSLNYDTLFGTVELS